jgi:hypothetical protein
MTRGTEMKQEIVKNEYYEIYVDEEINRAYWVLKGKWNKMTDIPNYMQDSREALRYMKPGFSVLTDIRTFEVPPQGVLERITESAKIVEDAGMGRQAHIINKKDIEAMRASRDVMKEADMDLKMMQFGSYEEAIEWLNR